SEGFGFINETAIQADGKVIAVGMFDRVGGIMVNGIARFNTDGTHDTTFNTGTGANAVIRTVAIQSDGKVLVGGEFTSFNGQPAFRLVRLNTNGSIDTGFVNPSFSG